MGLYCRRRISIFYISRNMLSSRRIQYTFHFTIYVYIHVLPGMIGGLMSHHGHGTITNAIGPLEPNRCHD